MITTAPLSLPDDGRDNAIRLALIALCLTIYLLPTLVAMLRGHRNMASIIVVNVFLGWLLVGWVVSMAWSVSSQRPVRTERASGSRRRRYSRR